MQLNYFYLARRNPSIKPEDWHTMWHAHSEFATGLYPPIKTGPKRVMYCAQIRNPRLDGKPFQPPGATVEYDGAAIITARGDEARPPLPPDIRAKIDEDELRRFDRNVRHFSFRGKETLIEGGEPGPAVVLRFLARKAGNAKDEFLARFDGQHADIARRAIKGAAAGTVVQRYVQNHVIEEPPPGYPFDAVSEVWFGSAEAATRSFVDPALEGIAQDLAAFCDMQRSVTLLGEVIMRRENP
jgi:uncharacterized protein (TIGR02118 family)